MNNSLSVLSPERKWLLYQAASDFYFLLNGSYPRKSSLELVGNRYDLNAFQRMLLSRGLFSQQEAVSRRQKRQNPFAWQKELLVVDGHNVQITIESHILGKTLLKSNDGSMRDLAGMSSGYGITESSDMALDMLFRFFRDFPPCEVLFLFDEPMSRSGEIAAMYRDRLTKAGIKGSARTSPVPEREFPYRTCIVAGSDRAVIDSSSQWVDLACCVIEYLGEPEITADFSGIILAEPAKRCSFKGGGLR